MECSFLSVEAQDETPLRLGSPPSVSSSDEYYDLSASRGHDEVGNEADIRSRPAVGVGGPGPQEVRLKQSRPSVSYPFLCGAPFLAVGLTVRPLRVPGLYQALGVIHFVAICFATWRLGAWALRSGTDEKKRIALAGILLVAPFALFALLWVGLATPWEATPTENRMRYLVLLAGALAVTCAFVVLRDAQVTASAPARRTR